jgi:uncharacterized protein (TIGR02246 family)
MWLVCRAVVYNCHEFRISRHAEIDMPTGRFAQWPLLTVAIIVACSIPSGAQTRGRAAVAAKAPSDEEVRRAIAEYREAVKKGDPEGIAAHWAADADYVDYSGRAFKVDTLVARAKNMSPPEGQLAPPPLDSKTLTLRFVTPDVVVEDGVIEPAAAAGEKSQRRRYSAVWVKRDGKWLIDGVRESPFRAPTAERFKELEWMIGDWIAEGPEATAEAVCTWGPDKSYILRQVTVTPKADKPISATQWIGWDPVHERIRSFVFDSRGGYGDGVWEKEGEAWVVTATGVLPDGRRTSATNLYSQLDENTALWESVDEDIEGRPGMDFRLRATRKTPKK